MSKVRTGTGPNYARLNRGGSTAVWFKDQSSFYLRFTISGGRGVGVPVCRKNFTVSLPFWAIFSGGKGRQFGREPLRLPDLDAFGIFSLRDGVHGGDDQPWTRRSIKR